MRILILGLVILLSNCASTTSNYYTNTVQSWRGANINDLLKTWGRPDRLGTGQDGTRMYVYQTQSIRNNGAPASPAVGVTTGTMGRPVLTTHPSANPAWNRGTLSQTCTAAFLTNSSGIITNIQVQGIGCFGTQDFANRLSNPKATNSKGA